MTAIKCDLCNETVNGLVFSVDIRIRSGYGFENVYKYLPYFELKDICPSCFDKIIKTVDDKG